MPAIICSVAAVNNFLESDENNDLEDKTTSSQTCPSYKNDKYIS